MVNRTLRVTLAIITYIIPTCFMKERYGAKRSRTLPPPKTCCLGDFLFRLGRTFFLGSPTWEEERMEHGQKKKTHFKHIVIGVGGIGSSALYWLSRVAGSDVLGIEQFDLQHSNGNLLFFYDRSSHRWYPEPKVARRIIRGSSDLPMTSQSTLGWPNRHSTLGV